MLDPVARRIQLSEYRINYGKALFSLPLKAFPLIVPAVGIILGILIQTYFQIDRFLILAGLAFTAALIACCVIRKWGVKQVLSVAFAAFILLGITRVYIADNRPANHINTFFVDNSSLAVVEGAVLSSPIINDYADWQFSSFRDRTMSFYMRIYAVKSASGMQPAQGTIRVQLSFIPAEPAIEAGDYIRLYCRLSKPKPPAERWQFNFHRYLHNNMIEASAYASHSSVVPIEQEQIKLNAARSFHSRLTTKIAAMLAPEETEQPAQGLLSAMVLGRRTNISSEVRDAFQETGLMHLLSLSGMHIGIFCGSVWLVMRILGVGQKTSALFAAAAILLFIFIVPVRAATLRATIIALTFAAALFFSRKPSAINTLALSAIIILLINPRELFSVGWQLSFGCVLSILILTSPIQNLINRLTSYRFLPSFTGKKYDIRNFSAAIILAISSSIAACIGSMGIIAYNFGVIYPLSAIWTVLLGLPFAIIINFSLLTIIISAAIPAAAPFMQKVAEIISDWFISSVMIMADSPASEILIGLPPLFMVILFYLSIVLIGLGFFILCRGVRFCGYITLAVLIASFGIWSHKTFNTNDLRLTILPVGHGQAIFAEFPNGKNILFDCGSSTFKDSGRRIASPFLRSRRVRQIDALAISHQHLDHINGLDYIFKKYKPRKVYTTEFFLEAENNPLFVRCDWICNEVFIPVYKDKRLDFVNKEGLKVKLMPPMQEFQLENDNSLVMLISRNNTTILLPADIEKQRQEEFLKLGITADILLMPHHGSTRTTLEEFTEKINPTKIIPNTPHTTMQPKTIIIP